MVPQSLLLVRPKTADSRGVSSDAPVSSPNSQPRSSGSPERSGSWSFVAPDGAYGEVIAWTSGEAWFDALMDTLKTMAGEELRRRAKVAPDTLLRVARADWLSADVSTGRGVSTAHETVAADLGMSAKTVQRSRALLGALGFAVTIIEGRYLTVEERRAAREKHGGTQIKAASLRALTIPKPSRPVRNVHLPRRGETSLSSHLLENSPKRADARKTAASRPKLAQKKRFTSQTFCKSDHHELPRPLAVQRLAAQLARRVRWLDGSRHIGALCDVLGMAGVDADRWSANDLVETMDRFVAEQRLRYPAQARNPLGFLRWILSAALDPNQLTPGELRAEREAERRARIARQLEEREIESRRLAGIDQAEIARIIAASNAEIHARNAESAAAVERERLERIRRQERERAARIRAAVAASRRSAQTGEEK